VRFPGRPLFLVGISLGAAVSLQALPRLPDVRGVWSEGAFARLRVPVDNQCRLLPGWLREPLVAAYSWLGWLDCGVWVPGVNPVEALAGSHVPVHFCHGREDRLVPFSEAEALYRAHPGPRQHWWAENASHYNVRQRNPEEYLGRLRAFLESCLQEPAVPMRPVTPSPPPTSARGPA
jgi:pimeloyl-ACP methyl ester carboxylesterase